jgi:hypothetical protein
MSGRSGRRAEARRLEEMALNASGAFQSLLYDGWLLGHRAGPTKRLRCINPTYRSSFPLEQKLAYCTDFYRTAGLPAIFRMLPFAQPVGLDAFLAERGWSEFERTLVLRAGLAAAIALPAPAVEVELVAMTAWVEATRALLGIASEAITSPCSACDTDVVSATAASAAIVWYWNSCFGVSRIRA